MEKDWGSAFPKTWVWVQASHFGADTTATLLLSVASIPFPSDAIELLRFRGFLGCLWLPKHGGLYRFATWSGAVIERMQVDRNQSRVEVVIRSAQHRLTVVAAGDRKAAVTLHGPTPGGRFEPFVHEMLDAELDVTLVRRADGAEVWSGHGTMGGLEIESREKHGLRLLADKPASWAPPRTRAGR